MAFSTGEPTPTSGQVSLTGALERPYVLVGETALLAQWLPGCPPLARRSGQAQQSSEALHKASREEACAAIPLQSPLVPAILALLVHEDDVTLSSISASLCGG